MKDFLIFINKEHCNFRYTGVYPYGKELSMSQNQKGDDNLPKKPDSSIDPLSWVLKFIPLAIIQTLALSSYTTLRLMKDNAIMRAIGDASLFAWLKLLAVMPVALFFTWLYGKLSSYFVSNRMYANYGLLAVFMLCNLFSAYVVFPYSSVIHSADLGAKLASIFPSFLAPACEALGATIGWWGLTLFYACSEVWGSIGISMLFWGTANSLVEKKEKSVFYPAFGIIGNLGAILASNFIGNSNLSGISNELFLSKTQMILLSIVASMMLIGLVCFFLQKFVLENPRFQMEKPSKKTKASTEGGFEMVFTNSYLRSIALIVISYNICINLIEISWKASIASTYGQAAFSPIQAKTVELNGIITVVLSAISAFFLSNLSLIVKAMLPVIMLGATGVIFLFFYAFGSSPLIAPVFITLGLYPAQLAVVLGALQNICSKSVKYSLFDTTKEQMFSAGDENVRTKGKAVIDVVLARLSKTVGGLIQTGLFIIVPLLSSFFFNPSVNVVKIEDPKIEVSQNIKDFIAPSIISEKVADGTNRITVITSKDAMINSDKSLTFTLSNPALVSAEQIKDTSEPTSAKTNEASAKDVDIAISKAKIVTGDMGTQLTFSPENSSTINTDNSITFIIEAPKKAPVKQKTKEIAPYLLIIVSIIVFVWAYAVIAVAPQYEEKIHEEGTKRNLADGRLSAKQFGILFGLSLVLCGGLYFWVSYSINQLVTKNNYVLQKNA